MDDFLKAEEVNPDELENTLYIGKCYNAMGQTEKAVEYLKKVGIS
jgi:tetratricopeptide (TPR) repeat protein